MAKHPSAQEQREALEWLMEHAIPSLEVLALRGQVDKVALAQHRARLEAIKNTLAFLQQPWVIELIMRGPPQ